jgi:hypothetical protein
VLDNRAFLLHHLDSTRRLNEAPTRPELLAILGESDKATDGDKASK